MALERDADTVDKILPTPDREYDRIMNERYDEDAGRSNFAAFLLGGIVIAGGLLAFLYYDTANLSRDDGLTTGSITRTLPREETQAPPALRVPVNPQSGKVSAE